MKAKHITAMILAFMMVFVFCVTAMAGEEIQMTGQNTEMNGMFGGKQSHGMRGGKNGMFNGQQPPEMNGEFNGQQPPEMNGEFNGQQPPEMNGEFNGQQPPEMNGEFNGQQPPEMNGEFNGQQPPEMNGEFNGQQPPEMNGERKDPFSEAIAALEDGETKDTLLALEEAVNTAIEAEMAAREAGEEDLSSYQEAVKIAQEALMTALQEAGIEIKVPADMGLNGGMKFNGQQPPAMNGEFNGQQPPEKPEGDLKPEIPSDTNE